MFTATTKYDVIQLMQDNFTDLDIFREKPFVFKSGKYLVVVAPVKFGEHYQFLKEMHSFVLDYLDILGKLDFLSAFDYKDEEVYKKLIEQVKFFEANNRYNSFLKEASIFISKWGYVTKKKNKGDVILKHSRRRLKRLIKNWHADEVIYFLFLLFVYNFDIAKKNLLEFLQIFQGEVKQRGKSSKHMQSSRTPKKKVVMPKYSEKPYSKETLDIFAAQSKM